MALNNVEISKTVDVAQAMPVPVIFAKQGEHHKRKVEVTILEDGKPFKLVSGNTGYVQGATAPDPKTKQRYRFKYTVAETNFGTGTMTFYIDRGMTQVIGITECELAIYDSSSPEEILCTANINIEVQGTGMSPEDEMASDDYQAIVSIKAEVTAMRDVVVTKTAEAITAKEQAETAAQNAYNSALNVQKIVAGNEAYTKQEADLKYSVAPRKAQSTTTGEMRLTDSDDGLAYLSLEGNSEQYTNTASKNLIDLEYQKLYGINENRYLDINGNITTPSVDKDWKVSYYIKVKPSTTYIFTNLPDSFATTVGFYTKDKTFISGINNSQIIVDGGIITTPSNCEYIRVSFRAGTENTLQLEEGNTTTTYIKGAVETPSPEYPSEVKSVGDIPKDVNGVEIKNVVDIESAIFAPESEWTVIRNNIFSVPIRVDKKKINGRLFNYTVPSMSIGLSSYNNTLTDGTNGFYLGAPTVPIKGFDFSGVSQVYLFIYTGSVEYQLSDIKEALRNGITKFMFTYASEVDEYRPYIGSNNGLVKIESARDNLVNADINFATSRNSTIRIANKGQDIVVTQTDIADTARTMLPIEYEVGKTYTLYYKAYRTELVGAGGETYVAVRDMEGAEPDIVSKLIPPTQTEILQSFTPTKDGLFLWLYVQSQAGKSQRVLYVNDLMIVEGEKTLQEMQALEYQPYHQQITWIPLREPLRGLPDGRADTIDRDGNVIQYIDYSGVEQYPIAQEPDQIFEGNLFRTSFKSGNYVGAAKKDNGVYCNIMKFKQTVSLQYGVSASPLYSVIYFNLKGKLSENTVDLARKFLNDNNAVFYFTLRTPITYQIPAVYIETYEPVTNVRCMNEVKPSTMGLDYKLAINSLIKRLEALETTAVQEVTRNV